MISGSKWFSSILRRSSSWLEFWSNKTFPNISLSLQYNYIVNRYWFHLPLSETRSSIQPMVNSIILLSEISSCSLVTFRSISSTSHCASSGACSLYHSTTALSLAWACTFLSYLDLQIICMSDIFILACSIGIKQWKNSRKIESEA